MTTPSTLADEIERLVERARSLKAGSSERGAVEAEIGRWVCFDGVLEALRRASPPAAEDQPAKAEGPSYTTARIARINHLESETAALRERAEAAENGARLELWTQNVVRREIARREAAEQERDALKARLAAEERENAELRKQMSDWREGDLNGVMLHAEAFRQHAEELEQENAELLAERDGWRHQTLAADAALTAANAKIARLEAEVSAFREAGWRARYLADARLSALKIALANGRIHRGLPGKAWHGKFVSDTLEIVADENAQPCMECGGTGGITDPETGPEMCQHCSGYGVLSGPRAALAPATTPAMTGGPDTVGEDGNG